MRMSANACMHAMAGMFVFKDLQGGAMMAQANKLSF
jgi:hypothetical protein